MKKIFKIKDKYKSLGYYKKIFGKTEGYISITLRKSEKEVTVGRYIKKLRISDLYFKVKTLYIPFKVYTSKKELMKARKSVRKKIEKRNKEACKNLVDKYKKCLNDFQEVKYECFRRFD